MLETATLEINLAALASNYQLLKTRHARGDIACVVKANAYGLGVEAVSKALHAQGCREFFVATLAEAVELRGFLPDAAIAVFNGLHSGEESAYREFKLTPVLNEVGQVERFSKAVNGERASAILHIDTGMTRLGLSQTELETFFTVHRPPSTIHLLMSHLACANEPAHPKNAEQLMRFKKALAHFPGARASLANSSGMFLPPEFHFDVGRPGCALYGINPTEGENPMQHVATLSAPILQIRTLDRDETVGYGATCDAAKGSRIAIAGLGYADGFFRSLSNKGHAYIAGRKLPILGRVSMDMIAVSLDTVPEAELEKNPRVEFINARQTVNDIAAQCGTIGYEIFTRIGRRVTRTAR